MAPAAIAASATKLIKTFFIITLNFNWLILLLIVNYFFLFALLMELKLEL